MRTYQLIEKYFWIFLVLAFLSGLLFPFKSNSLATVLRISLMIILFIVFLKTDFLFVFRHMKNYRPMAFFTGMSMVILPLLFFGLVNFFDHDLAVATLLLTAMPAGAVTPALTDVVKGKSELSVSLVILTSIVAPFTISLLFWILRLNHLSINPLLVFKDLALLIFLPMILSQSIKKYFSGEVKRIAHLFTSLNIFLLSFMVFAVIGSQQEIIFQGITKMIWQTGFLFLIFILLHIAGYLCGFKEDCEGKIATTIGLAYMNNSLAIVLAAVYFNPSILILMILSELPWNTLLIPLEKVTQIWCTPRTDLKNVTSKKLKFRTNTNT